jgi:hypothetical protein
MLLIFFTMQRLSYVGALHACSCSRFFMHDDASPSVYLLALLATMF